MVVIAIRSLIQAELAQMSIPWMLVECQLLEKRSASEQ